MAKVGSPYLEIDPYRLVEKGFHKEKNMVSESLFSLGNEYCGVRGFFEEGSSLPSLVGTYYNGIYENALEDAPNAYKGIVKRTHFTINSTNFLKITLEIDGNKLDLADAKIEDFERVLDMRNGLLTRHFVWRVGNKSITLNFSRLISMVNHKQAVQSIEIESNEDANLTIAFTLDGHPLHFGKHCFWEEGKSIHQDDIYGLYETTPTTHQSLLTLMKVDHEGFAENLVEKKQEISLVLSGALKKDQKVTFTRYVVHDASKSGASFESLFSSDVAELRKLKELGFAGLLHKNVEFFEKYYAHSDIVIDGNDEDQQGIRFCQFQMVQAYHGYEEDNNIGAKGLTGEAYSGHAFWDSETYCLPYFLFSDQIAARNLLMFRYHTLEEAKERAKDLDCEGACYPIATRNGKEACTLWQHASTQLQPTSAVGFAIYHYMNLYHDEAFMNQYGKSMLAEIMKFLFTRGQWNAKHTHFGYYGVMGPDEFQMMVAHNTYTNFMNKKIMEYALEILRDPRYSSTTFLQEHGLDEAYLKNVQEACDNMLILYDPKTKLFEQHQGYYDLPHIDVDSIPMEEFPLYSHWTYDRIYRNDMIKQPDVLMFMFLYNQDFTDEQLKANYEFYEPRTIHESSLSPSIHSILASQIGKSKEAEEFFGFATRLDLDDYNRNTCEGLHMTSVAAAWMNIVYGFLGMRSERPELKIAPSLPSKWKHYGVSIFYHGKRFKFDVYPDRLEIENNGPKEEIFVYGKPVTIDGKVVLKR